MEDHDQTIVPVATDQPAAPRQLMNIVTCGCKTGCGNACGCRKAGMVCSEMCYHCMGVSCDNAPEMDLDSQYLKLTQSKNIIERYVRV